MKIRFVMCGLSLLCAGNVMAEEGKAIDVANLKCTYVVIPVEKNFDATFHCLDKNGLQVSGLVNVSGKEFSFENGIYNTKNVDEINFLTVELKENKALDFKPQETAPATPESSTAPEEPKDAAETSTAEKAEAVPTSGYLNPFADGSYNEFNADGELIASKSYKNNKLDGEVIEYYKDKKVKSRTFYKEGKKDGESFEYSEDGKLLKQEVYKEGVLQTEENKAETAPKAEEPVETAPAPVAETAKDEAPKTEAKTEVAE